MNIWGVAMIIIGAYLSVSAAVRSDAVPFRYLVARARLLWKERTYPFLLVSGILVGIAGVVVLVR